MLHESDWEESDWEESDWGQSLDTVSKSESFLWKMLNARSRQAPCSVYEENGTSLAGTMSLPRWGREPIIS